MTDQPFSLINEDGSCADEYRGLVPDEDLLAMLRMIIFNRMLDRRMLMLQRQGRLGFYMTSTGEEAVIVGSTYCLQPRDPVFLQYRELGALLWRGVSLDLILNQLIGNSRDLCKGRQMPIHYCFTEWDIPSVSSPVGTQLPHACGYAWGARYQNTGQVSLAFVGEGTTSTGAFHSALNFSGVFKVPAVFVIRNNGYAISTPESIQTAAESLAGRGAGYGIPGVQIDGNDLLAVVSTVRGAVEAARSGEGPALIEALTYRLGAHSTADDPSAYRTDDETQSWMKVDALVRLKRHATWRGIWTDDMEGEIQASAEQRISETIAACEKWPPPRVETLFEDVYDSIPEHLEEQKAEYLRYLRRRDRLF